MMRPAADVEADAAWVESILSTVEVRGSDGWVFALEPGLVDGITMTVTWHVPCLERDGNVVTITQWERVDRYAERRDVDGLMRAVWYLMDRIEGHERLERLCVNGRPAFDPHPVDPRIPRWRP